MRSSWHSLDRVEVHFDDERLVANAGLIAPASLSQHLGLCELFDQRLDLGDAPGRANVGHKAMTVIHSVLAGSDSIDDCDVLRAGSTVEVLGHELRAPSTIGTFVRSFSWGHVRQLDSVAGEALARAWKAGAGPADRAGPFTIDLDSSIHETYGMQKEGGSRGYTYVRGYHPLYAFASDDGQVLHSRLRGGNAHTARGAAGFLKETFARVRAAGAAGKLAMRADSLLTRPRSSPPARRRERSSRSRSSCIPTCTPPSPPSLTRRGSRSLTGSTTARMWLRSTGWRSSPARRKGSGAGWSCAAPVPPPEASWP